MIYSGLLLPDNLDTFDTIYVVFEYVQTDLERLLRSDQNFTTLHIQYFLYQILRGLRYVHAQNVIHRDIKPANLLVNADCSLKICDFGLSRTTNDVYRAPQQPQVKQPPAISNKLPDLTPQRFTRQMTKHVVTRWYRAPELILMANDYGPSNSYSAAIDMWACGCILAELLSMQKESHEQPDERAALFPGKTCFPLSAENVTAYSDRLVCI
jgi:mitogen-activated protein kinase 1/3